LAQNPNGLFAGRTQRHRFARENIRFGEMFPRGGGSRNHRPGVYVCINNKLGEQINPPEKQISQGKKGVPKSKHHGVVQTRKTRKIEVKASS